MPPNRTTALVRKGNDLLEERSGVVAVQQLHAGEWNVTFEDGVVWNVKDQKSPCGCGGG